MQHKILPAETEWPNDLNERIEALVLRQMTRILEIDAIAKNALAEEASACYQVISDDWEDLRQMAREMMQRINRYIRRQDKIALRQAYLNGVDVTGMAYPMTTAEAIQDCHDEAVFAARIGDDTRYKAVMARELALLGKSHGEGRN